MEAGRRGGEGLDIGNKNCSCKGGEGRKVGGGGMVSEGQ